MGVKKSRFLGYAKHVENWDEAQTYIEEVKAEHPKDSDDSFPVSIQISIPLPMVVSRL
jgi:putative IMPACT (imprinted ancient) family translation regulator